jgi:hypothetical protein
MTFLTWFFGGERYRINFALVAGIAIAMAPGDSPLLGLFIAVPLLVFMGFRYRKWRKAQVAVTQHRDD